MYQVCLTVSVLSLFDCHIMSMIIDCGCSVLDQAADDCYGFGYECSECSQEHIQPYNVQYVNFSRLLIAKDWRYAYDYST